MTGDDGFRALVRGWLGANLPTALIGTGGPGREHELIEERRAWERTLGAAGWIGIAWPEEDGGRGLSWRRQVIFHEEYARACAPGRVGHIGEQLLGPTLIMFGTRQQKKRFLPPILAGDTLWCQGYSEPDAGSDLAALRTRAVLDGGSWRIDGQKVWTSLAQHADWCFLLARTDTAAERHRGLSCLLVPMDQPGITVRPIRQLTGTSEFCEVFFDDARTSADNVVGAPGDGWRVALGTLAVERGASTFGQQLAFTREFEAVLRTARGNGAIADPAIADRITGAWIGLTVMRCTAEQTLGDDSAPGAEASVNKLLWGPWHQRLGELAVDVTGPDATLAGPGYELSDAQRLFLFSRADTIYGGSSEIQREIIAERRLGMPSERAKGAAALSGLRSAGAKRRSDEGRRRLVADPEASERGKEASECAENRELALAIRGVLAGPAHAAWAGLTAVGVPGLAVPEKYGGAGASLAEVGVAVGEAGRVLLPEPVLSTTLAAAVLAEAGSGSAAAEFLPDLAAGRLKAAFVFTGDIEEEDGRLSGTADHVLDGGAAGLLLVRAGQEMFAVQGGDFVMTEMGVLDQTRSQGAVRFDGAAAVRTGVSAARAEDLLRVLLAVESAAAAEYCLDVTVAYLKTRVQFGRPLAGFQVLRHRCADLAVEVASATATAQAAIERPRELAALAKLHCADVFWHVAAEMVQLHGGIGITWEHQAHRYLKRAKATQLLHGSPSELRAMVAARAGLAAD